MQPFMDAMRQNTMFITFLGSFISLSVSILAGYVCRKKQILNDTINDGMSTLLVKITMPCTVFMSLMRPFSRALLLESAATFLLLTAIYLAGYVIGGILGRLLKVSLDEKRIWQFSLIFANVGYMGFPITQAVFGSEAMIYTTMANASFNVLAFTMGINLLKPKNENVKFNLRLILLNPVLVAIYIGFIFFVTGFRLPDALNTGIAMIGNMTTPISMLLVGSILAKGKLSTLFANVKILPVIFMRLLGIPLAALLLLRPFIHNEVMLGVIVILSAMPVASLTVIFAEQYKSDTALASKLVAISTLLCILSVPIISIFLR